MILSRIKNQNCCK